MDDFFSFSFFGSSGLTPGERAASPFRSLTPEQTGKHGPRNERRIAWLVLRTIPEKLGANKGTNNPLRNHQQSFK